MATATVTELTDMEVKAALQTDRTRYGVKLARLQARMKERGIQRRLVRHGVILDTVWVAAQLYDENRLDVREANPGTKHKCYWLQLLEVLGETSPELNQPSAEKLVQRIDVALFGCSLCGDIPRLEPSDVPGIWRPAPWNRVWRDGRYWAVDKHNVIWGWDDPLANQAADPEPLSAPAGASSQATNETPAVEAVGGHQDDAGAQQAPTTLLTPAGPTAVQPPTIVDAGPMGQANPTAEGVNPLGGAQAGGLFADMLLPPAIPMQNGGGPAATNIAEAWPDLGLVWEGEAQQGPADMAFDLFPRFGLQLDGHVQMTSTLFGFPSGG